nr:RNA polymerase sigma-70 factor [Pedobacter sp. B4-66]
MSALYLRYWDKLLSVACHRLDDPEGAEEVVQDIFFALWQRRASLDIKYSLSTYLAVAVKYRIINLMDKQYRLRNKEKLLPPVVEYELSSEEYIFEKELWERIEASIKQLPSKCQIVFRMSREKGMSNKQIAAELDIAEKTVEAHMSKALRDIRGNLTLVLPTFLLTVLEQNKFHL